MNVVIAIDSLKGSLDSASAGDAIARGVHAACPDAETTVFPIADGGEGTLQAILSACGGTTRTVTVHNPRGRLTDAAYGILQDGVTAVIEMAAAAGLPLLSPDERDPLCTTTFGVGELIADALACGCRRFIIGLGGSATNDGGTGMLKALGARFLDQDGLDIANGAIGLASLHTVDVTGLSPALADCTFAVACDVRNPLCGEEGCSAVFAPQKGAKTEDIPRMDAWLSRYAALTKAILPDADPAATGAGAAGGMGFACKAYLNARLVSGIDLLIEEIGLDRAIADADLVITGEGRLDGQSLMGKAPIGVATVAARNGVPVLALAGSVAPDAAACNTHGITAFFSILPRVTTPEEAMDPAVTAHNLTATAEQAMRLFTAGRT